MHDTVIAGAGPVGLFLAGELALSGCSVLIIERDREPTSPLKALPLGLRGLNAGSAETLHRRGLLEAMTEASGVDGKAVGADPDASGPPAPRSVSHFAGMGLDAGGIDASALPFRLPGPATEGFMTSLEAVSTVLARRAASLGVEIVRGVPVTAVTQDDDGATATAGGQEYRGRWLVGCDGGRSAVRALAGFDFVGTDPLFTGYAAKVTWSPGCPFAGQVAWSVTTARAPGGFAARPGVAPTRMSWPTCSSATPPVLRSAARSLSGAVRARQRPGSLFRSLQWPPRRRPRVSYRSARRILNYRTSRTP
ncbi:FAD-dependent monooxygenase [Kitasatospora sp. NPDC101447]|uniref:FAD-dependent monooxygenase n=1 Tax=Kitasatospora sp. NPDC101447 TaxID=3364102 RepID=UPI00381F1B75